jgi:hypothetical protein
VLGPHEDHTRDAPTWDGECYSGGLAFKRNDCAKHVNEEGRTYTLANSLQKQKSWVGPCEGAKSFGGVPDEVLIIREKLIKVEEPPCLDIGN